MSSAQPTLSLARIPISSLSLQKFTQQFRRCGTPVIMTDLLKGENCWNLESLCQELEGQEFLLRYYGNARYQQDKRQWTSIGSGVQTKRLRFEEYAKLLDNREAHRHDIYLAKCAIANTPLAQNQALQKIDQQLEQLGFSQAASGSNLWVGPGGHVECLHYDPTDGVLIQLHGTKRIVLFPSTQTHNLYPYPIHTHLRYGLKLRCWFSQVYPDHPDFTAFPQFRNALLHKYEILLQPGEALYIPAGWWHEVTALGDEMVCSVNRFWRVTPLSRAVFTWNRWRAFIGSFCAIPYTLLSLIVAALQGRGQQKLQEIKQML